MRKAKFEIEGMSCQHCVKAVRNALAELPGVSVDDVSIGGATVEFDPTASSVDSVVDAIADAGYEAREISTAG
jgi:copper ion binding protein